MAQTPVTVTVANDSDTVACAEDLSAVHPPAALLLPGYPTALPVAAILPPGGGIASWRVRLAARYAGLALTAVTARLHTSFTGSGLPLWDPGDTGTRPLLNQTALVVEARTIRFPLSALGPRTIYASQAGVPLDADLEAATGTDVTQVLQQILNQAGDDGAPLTLIIDGPALVSCLDLYSNTRLVIAQGIVSKAGTGRTVLRNAHPSRTQRLDHDIVIEGPGTIHCNPFGQPAQTQPDGTFIVGVGLYGVTGAKLKNFEVRNSCTFAVHISNCARVRAHDLFLNNYNHFNLGDGFHVNGPAEDIQARGLRGTAGDDFVSICADDGPGGDSLFATNFYGPLVGEGDILGVHVDDITVDNALYGVRLLSKTKRLDDVTISRMRGTLSGRNVASYPYQGPYNGNIGRVAFEDIDVQVTGAAARADWYFGGSHESITLRNIRATNRLLTYQRPWMFFEAGPFGEIIIDGVRVSESGTTSMGGTSLLAIYGDVTEEISIHDVNWKRADSLPKDINLAALNTPALPRLDVAWVRAKNCASLFTLAGDAAEVRLFDVSARNLATGAGVLEIQRTTAAVNLMADDIVGAPAVVGSAAGAASPRTGNAFLNTPSEVTLTGYPVDIPADFAYHYVTGLTVALPGAGTYTVSATLRVSAAWTGGLASVVAGLYDDTVQHNIIQGTERMLVTNTPSYNADGTYTLRWLVNAGGPTALQLHLQGRNLGGVTWSSLRVSSDSYGRSSLGWQ